MKFYLFTLVLIVSCGKSTNHLPTQWIAEGAPVSEVAQVKAQETFDLILDSHSEALESLEQKGNQKNLPFGFEMKEMVTDIAVTKSGILGLSALNSNNGVEIKWKKTTPSKNQNLDDDTVDMTVDENQGPIDLESMTNSIAAIAKSSGKVKKTSHLKKTIYKNLKSLQEKISLIRVTQFGNWRLHGLRLDLNFSVDGQVWLFTKAGTALRIRMEWKLKEVSYSLQKTKLNDESRFVLKTLDSLNTVLPQVHLAGFEPKKISIGIGTTYKGQMGIWKYSTGFLGFLMYVPQTNSKEIHAPLPKDLEEEDFYLGSDLEATKRRGLSKQCFETGLLNSLKIAAAFTQNISEKPVRTWHIAEIKTVNDITYTGLFGLAPFTTRGALEIDFKRQL